MKTFASRIGIAGSPATRMQLDIKMYDHYNNFTVKVPDSEKVITGSHKVFRYQIPFSAFF